ncbi:MAG: hypothetical protein KBT49_05745 [Bacteroidetes bacterium]|nr:hypothetical protein [Candidatus Colenecus caballi]
MKLSESSFQELKELIENALKAFRKSDDQSVVTDIHIQPVRETGQVTVSDDDRDLGTATLSDLQDIPEENFYEVMEKELRRLLQQIDQSQPLEQLAIWKPFSFVLVDDDMETISELMLFDEDNTLLSQGLMQGLDEDLDQFLKDLLAD